MNSRFAFALWALVLAGCAATPMQPEVWDASIAAQAERIGLQSRCCSESNTLPTIALGSGLLEFAMDANAAIVKANGAAAPAVRIALPAQAIGKQIQFFSYSDGKRSALQLGSLIFLRPTLVFLDASGTELSVAADQLLCWGESQGSGGVWARTDIPSGAASVVVAASIAATTQFIDTRRFDSVDSMGAVGGAVATAIADSRQSYINEIRVGYEGLASLELVDRDQPALGHCVANP